MNIVNFQIGDTRQFAINPKNLLLLGTSVPITVVFDEDPDTFIIKIQDSSFVTKVNDSMTKVTNKVYTYNYQSNSTDLYGEYFVTLTYSLNENIYIHQTRFILSPQVNTDTSDEEVIDGTVYNVITVDTDTTVESSTNIILVDATDGNIILTLFTAVGNIGKKITIKKIDSSSNTVTIILTEGETIDGQSSWPIAVQYQAVQVVSDGNNWFVIS